MKKKDDWWQEYKVSRNAELKELWTSGHRLAVGKDGLLYDTGEVKFEIFWPARRERKS